MSDTPTPKLLFSNPTFHDGINLTVRKGTKWNGVTRFHLMLGGEYSVYVTSIHTKVVVFKDLNDIDLIHEHDPICRTKEGLFKVMGEVYPGFSEDDEVTLVHFILNYRTPQIGDNACVRDWCGPMPVGTLYDVIPLNDDFYEIHSRTKFGYRETVQIVHASEWNPSDGWYVG